MIIFNILFNIIDNLYLLAGYLKNGDSFPKPLSEEEERELFIKLKQGDPNTRSELILRNLRLAAHIAKKYYNQNHNKDDLISSGTVGLIKAVDSFDCNKGNRFAAFAARCIENEILMYIRNQKKFKSEISLEDPIGVDNEGNEISFIDILGTDSELIHLEVENNILIKKVYQLMDSVLDDREKIIIQLRFGLICEPKTQIEIARLLGVSRSYISRIESKAIKILRKEMNK